MSSSSPSFPPPADGDNSMGVDSASRHLEGKRPAEGDIRWILPSRRDGAARLGLVTRLFAATEGAGSPDSAQVVLVSTHAEHATDRDAIVDAKLTGLAGTVLIETDMVCCVWLSQLGKRFAGLPQELAAAVAETEVRSALQGPWRGLGDRRWSRPATQDTAGSLANVRS